MVTVVVGLLCLFPPKNVAAEVTKTGFTVSPAQLSFTVNPDASAQVATVTIENGYDVKLQLGAELRSIDESSVRLVPAGPIDTVLAEAIQLSASTITVPAHSSALFQVRVKDVAALADGGHYASLVLTQRSADGPTSSFRSAVAVSLFIIKNQNIRTDLRLDTFEAGHSLFSLPASAEVSFNNLGNTHVVPRGSVSIYDGETLVRKAVLNTESQLLFPEGKASFTGSFDTYETLWLPRKLRMQLTYRIDGSDVQLIKEQTFWYIPPIIVVALFILGAALWRLRRQIASIVKLTGESLGRLWPFGRRRTAKTARSTRRILGQTVIRSHHAASVMTVRAKASKVLGSSVLPKKQLPAKLPIVVKVAADDKSAPPPPTSKPPKTVKKTSKTVAKSAATPVKSIPKKTAPSSRKKTVATKAKPKKAPVKKAPSKTTKKTSQKRT